jgi:hypothetical protein
MLRNLPIFIFALLFASARFGTAEQDTSARIFDACVGGTDIHEIALKLDDIELRATEKSNRKDSIFLSVAGTIASFMVTAQMVENHVLLSPETQNEWRQRFIEAGFAESHRISANREQWHEGKFAVFDSPGKMVLVYAESQHAQSWRETSAPWGEGAQFL